MQKLLKKKINKSKWKKYLKKIINIHDVIVCYLQEKNYLKLFYKSEFKLFVYYRGKRILS